MSSNIFHYFITNELAHALFFTLIHSLWQGIFVALIASIILIRTKRSGASFRYTLLCGSLLLFIVTNFVTFLYELHLSVPLSAKSLTTFSIVKIVSVNFNSSVALRTSIISVLKSGENFMVLTWFIVFMLKCIQLLTGLRSIYILKHKQVFDAGTYWNNKLCELAVKTGITKPVKLLQSALAEIPMVIGYLKPVILFPAAALTTLAPQEIEAVLLHELAHIKRRDYLVNILQSLTEIIFFFNPAVLWISSLIKEERENCCDDMAVKNIKNKKHFIYALMAFQQYTLQPKQAAFFSGRNHYLFNRIKRIITNNNKTLNTMEKTFLVAGIFVTSFIAVAFIKIKQPVFTNAGYVIEQAKSNFFTNKKDTTEPATINDNAKTFISNSVLNGNRYKLIENNGKTELYVDGVKIPENKISDYKDVITKLKQQMTAAKQEKVKTQAAALAVQAESMKANDMAMEAQAEALKDQVAAIDDSVNSNLSNEQVEVLKDQAAMLQQQAVKMEADIKNEVSDSEQEEFKAQADEYEKQAMAMKNELQSKSGKMRAEALKAQAEITKQQPLIKKAELDKQMEQLRKNQKKLVEQSEIMKEQQLQMKVEMDKQTELIKQQQSQMKKDIEVQKEELKEENEKLIKDSTKKIQLNNR